MWTIHIPALGLFVIATLFVAGMHPLDEAAYIRSMARAGAGVGMAIARLARRLAEAAIDLVSFLPAIMIIAGFQRRALLA